MNKFLGKVSWFALIGTMPFLLVLGIYVAADPFKVIHWYDPIYTGDVVGEVSLNRDYIGTVTLLNNYQERRYDSFVLGNSRSFIYGTDDWKTYLPAGSSCYHYNAPGEVLHAITKKVEFIDNLGLPIKNVLLVLDNGILQQKEVKKGHIFMMSPQLADNENLFEFHLASLKAFVNPSFLRAYADFRFTGKVKPYMLEGGMLNRSQRTYNVASNELKMDYYEDLIERGEYFTPERMAVFYARDSVETEHPQFIDEQQKQELQAMHRIFEKHGTNCKVIISPGYDQRKLHNSDLQYLRELFGAQHIFDFSGKNPYTEDYRNHYEQFHYRATVARDIMNEVYSAERHDAVSISSEG